MKDTIVPFLAFLLHTWRSVILRRRSTSDLRALIQMNERTRFDQHLAKIS
jgi:hypothetical protein